MDLLDFFPTIVAARVVALFRTAGYPGGRGADPGRALHQPRAVRTLAEARRPRSPAPTPGGPASFTAGPTSRRGLQPRPRLANLCAYRLDCRLAGLAASAGATYTRYADDLAFSGDGAFARSIARFHVHACAIALEEGFAVNTAKTRVMRQGVRQALAGAVLNVRPNIARDDFDALKATLHNCVKHGPEGQNRAAHADFRAHLLGRIAHVATLNPDRAGEAEGDVRPGRVVFPVG